VIFAIAFFILTAFSITEKDLSWSQQGSKHNKEGYKSLIDEIIEHDDLRPIIYETIRPHLDLLVKLLRQESSIDESEKKEDLIYRLLVSKYIDLKNLFQENDHGVVALRQFFTEQVKLINSNQSEENKVLPLKALLSVFTNNELDTIANKESFFRNKLNSFTGDKLSNLQLSGPTKVAVYEAFIPSIIKIEKPFKTLLYYHIKQDRRINIDEKDYLLRILDFAK